MITKDNPAGRLYDILDQFRHMQAHNKISTKSVWADVFGEDKENVGDLFHRLAQLHEMVAETKQNLTKIKGLDLPRYLTGFPNIEKVLSVTNLDEAWHESRDGLDDITMSLLAFCSDALSKENSEPSVDENEVAELQSEVESLIEKVELSESLDDGFKDVLLEQLKLIRRAILDYRIRGVASLRKAYQSTVVITVANRKEFEEAQDKDVIGGFVKILSRLSQMAALVPAGQKLVKFVSEYFPKLLEFSPK